MSWAPAHQPNNGKSAEIADRVVTAGWIHLSARGESSLGGEVLALARSLGAPVAGRRGRVLEVLTPQSAAAANVNSLSSLHGQGAFPLHTDGAHRLVPPRFLVLACDHAGSSPVPTIMLRFSDIGINESERRMSEAATFLIRNGRRSFYSTVLDSCRSFVRFDRGCMVPLGDEARSTLGVITTRFGEAKLTEHHWKAGDILVIDNWHVLHGRGRATNSTSSDRRLLRVSVQ